MNDGRGGQFHVVGESDMRGAGVKLSSGIRFGSMNMEGSAVSPAVMVARGMEPASAASMWCQGSSAK